MKSALLGIQSAPARSRKMIWDKLGIIASGLCLIDCIVLPVVSTTLLLFSQSSWGESMHHALLPLIFFTGGLAFYHSFKIHRSYILTGVAISAFTLILIGEIFEEQMKVLPVNVLSLAGSLLLISAHIRNIRLHHRGSCHSCVVHSH